MDAAGAVLRAYLGASQWTGRRGADPGVEAGIFAASFYFVPGVGRAFAGAGIK